MTYNKLKKVVPLAIGLSIPLLSAAPVGTSFTYQGQLQQAGVPVNASCAMVITLWNDPIGSLVSNQVGPTLTFDDAAGNAPKIVVTEGLFQIDLDFGAGAFNTDARWLQISVCSHLVDCTDPANFTTLSPRQRLAPTPFSMATRGITVDGNGRVGIGSATPVAPLHVNGTARVDGVLFADGTFQSTAAEETPITWSGLGNSIHNVNNGNVGIGTSAPQESLHVLSTGDHAIFGDNSNPLGTGLFGLHRADTGVTPGLLGETRSTDSNSVAVSGLASANSGANFGGGFTSLSPDGTGLLGLHFADTGTAPGILGRTNSNTDFSTAISGLAAGPNGNTSGGSFESKSGGGTGVFGSAPFQGVHGTATAEAGPLGLPPVGVTGVTMGPDGVGVYGQAINPAGAAQGVLGYSAGESGSGVLGVAVASAGESTGVEGRSESTEGVGVLGTALATSGETAGVSGKSASTEGTGVIGTATAETGEAVGVYGQSASTEGLAVFGRATAETGNTVGILGQSKSINGVGVQGMALALTGKNIGVLGVCDSPDGLAGYFEGKSYFSDRVGIGTRTPKNDLDVEGSVRVGFTSGVTESENVFLSSTPGNPFNGYVGVAGFSSARRAEMFVAGSGTGELRTLGFDGSNNVVIGAASAAGVGRNQGRVTILDNNEGPIIDLSVQNNEGRIAVADATGLEKVVISSHNGAGEVHTFGKNGLTNVLITHNDEDQDLGELYVANASGQPRIQLLVDGNGDGLIVGDTISANVKNFRVPNPDQPGTEIWYASLEGPEAGAYVRGTATLTDGEAILKLPDHFRAVAVEAGMTVQVTPLSADSLGLAVIRKSLDGIAVKELHQGKGSYEFDYRITAVRRGHENYRVIRPALRPAIPRPRNVKSALARDEKGAAQ